IERGIYSNEQVKSKVKEAKDEILGAFRVSENLGFTVDANYNSSTGDYFDFINSAHNVVELYQSEAKERHIELKLFYNDSILKIWGDQKGIENALGQFIINAIKYSYGSTYVRIDIRKSQDNLEVDVTNIGFPIDEKEKNNFWDFGYRGKMAFEKHVNGAGIGLATVKKIILAHGGNVSCKSSRSDTKTSIFSFSVPLDNILNKISLL
nr:HAMP domain-containing sensor histidine kinase [Melioribacteraceae bacterium]